MTKRMGVGARAKGNKGKSASAPGQMKKAQGLPNASTIARDRAKVVATTSKPKAKPAKVKQQQLVGPGRDAPEPVPVTTKGAPSGSGGMDHGLGTIVNGIGRGGDPTGHTAPTITKSGPPTMTGPFPIGTNPPQPSGRSGVFPIGRIPPPTGGGKPYTGPMPTLTTPGGASEARPRAGMSRVTAGLRKALGR